jgi:hypothetical protein
MAKIKTCERGQGDIDREMIESYQELDELIKVDKNFRNRFVLQ